MWRWDQSKFWDWLFPPRCASCGQPGFWFCDRCRTELALVRTPLCYRCGRLSENFRICTSCRRYPGLVRLIFCGYWQDPLRRLVLQLKYRRLRILADELVSLMVDSFRLVNGKIEVVVPVPLHWKRGWQRGFNQAEVLGREFAHRMDIRFANALARRRPTQPQFSLTKNLRRSNVAGAFDLKEGGGAIISGKIIVVVDDVTATGSTLEECAKVLRRGGAKEVWGLVIARA